jgi:hypothetical protein
MFGNEQFTTEVSGILQGQAERILVFLCLVSVDVRFDANPDYFIMPVLDGSWRGMILLLV